MQIKQAMLAVVIGTCMLAPARASFYVNDDVAAIPLAQHQTISKNKTVYVTFNGQRLSGLARAEIETAADTISGTDQVTIMAFAKTAKQLPAAKLRVASVKAALVRRGVQGDQITINTELDPQLDITDTDVQITFRTPGQRPTTDSPTLSRIRNAIAPQPAYAPIALPAAAPIQAPSLTTGPVTPSTETTAKLELVKKIMAMATAKLISQESAVKLVNEYLASTAAAPAQNPSASQTIPAAPQIVPFGEVPRVWTLAANKSLQENVREWALTAGYNEPAWLASNPYQVTYSSTYTGTFVEVLNQLATSVPSLDFRLARTARRLEVVDHR